MELHPRVLDYPQSELGRMIPDEAEITAGVHDPPGPVLWVLHRHHAVHRLQGLRGRLQGVEQPARGRPRPDRQQLRQHRRALGHIPGGMCSFVEQAGVRERRADAVPERLADDERRLQALPQRALRRGLPDRRAVPHRVRHRGGAAGHLQRLRLLRAGLPVRRGRA